MIVDIFKLHEQKQQHYWETRLKLLETLLEFYTQHLLKSEEYLEMPSKHLEEDVLLYLYGQTTRIHRNKVCKSFKSKEYPENVKSSLDLLIKVGFVEERANYVHITPEGEKAAEIIRRYVNVWNKIGQAKPSGAQTVY